MEIRNIWTKTSFKSEVERLKKLGYKFLGYTWNCACFENVILVRKY